MRLLLTGDYGGVEFSAAVATMRAACDVIEKPCLAQAAAWLTESAADLVVVAQARPGQFTAAEVETLRRASPLAPLVALVGSWCEGEPRSGTPWPGVVRVYWHQWSTRFPLVLARLTQGELSDWNQPPTATPEERLLSLLNAPAKRLAGVIAVVSDCFEMAEWLSAACRASGMTTILFSGPPVSRVEGIDVVIWDAGLARLTVAEQFRQVAASFFQVPVIVLLNFPRSSDVEQLTRAGAAAVLAKPMTIADLRFTLEQLLLAARD